VIFCTTDSCVNEPHATLLTVTTTTFVRLTLTLCVYTHVNCDDYNLCTIDYCDNTTGSCIHTAVCCGNECTEETTALGCIYNYISWKCNDNNVCTKILTAMPLVGVNTIVQNVKLGTNVSLTVSCDDGDYCTTDECTPTSANTTPLIAMITMHAPLTLDLHAVVFIPS